MCVLLITRLLKLVGRWARKPVNHTSWVALVTPTDRPKSVCNRCLIELFCGVVCVVTCPFDISVGVGAFVIGLGQIFSFLSFVFTICSIYAPPSKCIDISELQHLFSQIQGPVMFLGDFNAHNPLWGSENLTLKGRVIETFITQNDLCLFNDG